MLLRIGREYGVTAVRVPDEPLWFAARGGHGFRAANTALLAPWIALMKRRLRLAQVPYNDRIFGVAASGAMDEAKLLAILERLPEGVTEIYLHPATESGSAIAASMSTYAHARRAGRAVELRASRAANRRCRDRPRRLRGCAARAPPARGVTFACRQEPV